MPTQSTVPEDQEFEIAFDRTKQKHPCLTRAQANGILRDYKNAARANKNLSKSKQKGFQTLIRDVARASSYDEQQKRAFSAFLGSYYGTRGAAKHRAEARRRKQKPKLKEKKEVPASHITEQLSLPLE